MPNTNDFKKSKKNKSGGGKHSQDLQAEFPQAKVASEADAVTRRPQHQESAIEDVVAVRYDEEPKPETGAQPQTEAEVESTDAKPDFKFNFLGADLVKATVPQTFNFAEKLTGDWLNNGDFTELPIEQPLIQYYLGEGLRKAKKTEQEVLKKVEETNIVPLAKMVAESVLQKILKK